jgi:hypothetical protein
MPKDKFFPTLAGAPLDEPLTRAEKDALWEAVRRGIHRRPAPRRAVRFLTLAAAAVVVLSLGTAFLVLRDEAPEAVPEALPEALPAALLAVADPPPMIDSWEGSPSMIYETEGAGVKVAFVVDSSLQWE